MATRIYTGVGGKARKVKRIYIGVDGKARSVKKVYVGVNGKARLCWMKPDVFVKYSGNIVKLSKGRENLTASTAGDYALFIGGDNGSSLFNTVDVYHKSLVKSSTAALKYGTTYHASGTIGDYTLVAGGARLSGSSIRLMNSVTTYSAVLVQSTASSLPKACVFATSVPVSNRYLLFAGGQSSTSDTSWISNVVAYDKNLSKTTANNLSNGRYHGCGVKVGNYGIMAGGYNIEVQGSGGAGIVNDRYCDAYNSSLTKVNISDLSSGVGWATHDCVGLTIGNEYGVICSNDHAEIYDSNLTKSIIDYASFNIRSIKLSGSVLDGCGIIYNDYNGLIISQDLTIEILSASKTTFRCEGGATSIGNYSICAGNDSYTTDIYVVEKAHNT